jgi:hypothetical protein
MAIGLHYQRRVDAMKAQRHAALGSKACVDCGWRWRQHGPYCRTCARARGDMRTLRQIQAEQARTLQATLVAAPPTREPREVIVDGVLYEVVWP